MHATVGTSDRFGLGGGVTIPWGGAGGGGTGIINES